MFPENFEPLSFDDNVVLARINLCCAAIALLVSAFLLEWGNWPERSLPLAAAAGLIYLARQIDGVFRRLDCTVRKPEQQRPPLDNYFLPF
jgi:predicted RNA polymerase sigma factor